MGIMLVYDITSAKTFDNITKWLRNIDEVITYYIFLLLCHIELVLHTLGDFDFR